MALAQEWFTAADLANLALPGVPTVKANVIALADRENWRRPEYAGKRWRKRDGKGGGFEYHWSLLPPAARLEWAAAHSLVDGAAEHRSSVAAPDYDKLRWEWFFRLPDARRDEAARRLLALDQVVALVEQTGRSKTRAVDEIAEAFGVTNTTIYNWEKSIVGVARVHWLPALAPHYVGRTVTAECTPEAWDALYVEYARKAQPTFSNAYRKIKEAADKNGWTMPSEATLWRRMKKIDPAQLALARLGDAAVKRMVPAQRRDKTVFHALQAVNADGHKFDVRVRWPDGEEGRPMLVAFQDIYSGMFLSWRLGKTENTSLIRLAFGDMVEQFGVPEFCYLDNGRAFASKQMTGGTKTRFRYRVREEDPEGIMVRLGVKVQFTTPYSGQSKPIERGFGDFARNIAKDIRLEGAYLGNSPMNKPDNYGTKVVSLDLFLKVLNEGIIAHNTRVGRTSAVCGGRLSFQQAFDESYASAIIRKVGAEQKQMWLLAADNVFVSNVDGCIEFKKNRYGADFLRFHMGSRVTVRFDPDALHEDLFVYRADGSLIGQAPCIDAVGFNSVEEGKAAGRRKASLVRLARDLDDASRRMTVEQQIRLTARNDIEPPAAETKVVRMVRGNTALRAQPVPSGEEQISETDRLFEVAMLRMRAARGDHLSAVPNDLDETDADV